MFNSSSYKIIGIDISIISDIPILICFMFTLYPDIPEEYHL